MQSIIAAKGRGFIRKRIHLKLCVEECHVIQYNILSYLVNVHVQLR